MSHNAPVRFAKAVGPTYFGVLALMGMLALGLARVLMDAFNADAWEVLPIVLLGVSALGIGVYVLVHVYIGAPLVQWVRTFQERRGA